MSVFVNYSANFYCKIALVNRFKLYFIKTYSKTLTTKKQIKRKQKQRTIYLTNVTLIIMMALKCRISDIIGLMSNGVTVKRWTYDNAQRHVMAFRPISEAARSWSDDNEI